MASAPAGAGAGLVRRGTSAITSAWMRWWFTPSPASDIGFARAVFFTATFALYVGEDWTRWGAVSPAFWMPIWLFDRFDLPVASPAVLGVVQVVWKLSLLLGAVGLFSRTASAVACAAGLYLLGLPHNFGQTYHFDALLVIIFGMLAFARIGDAWSIDALLRRAGLPAWKQELAGQEASPAPSAEYRWPLRVVWLALALVLFAAGVSKLRHSGLEWVFSDTMAIYLTRAHYSVSDADPLVDWGLFIASSPWLSRGLAGSALLVEALFPLALVSTKARWLLVPSSFLMFITIRALMGPTFGGFLGVFAFWVPWTKIGELVAARSAPAARLVLVYDGAVGFCSRVVRVVRGLDVLGRVELRDAVSEWRALSQRFPALRQQACLEEMHVVASNGRRIYRGFRAYRALAWHLPAGWLVLPFLYLPGAALVGDAVYRHIASRRSRACLLVPADGPMRRRPVPDRETSERERRTWTPGTAGNTAPARTEN